MIIDKKEDDIKYDDKQDNNNSVLLNDKLKDINIDDDISVNENENGNANERILKEDNLNEHVYLVMQK